MCAASRPPRVRPTEAQIQALEKKKLDDEAWGEIDTAHPGYLGSQDTFYVGTLKGVGRVYQQTYIDTYAKVAQAKLYKTKTPITAAGRRSDLPGKKCGLQRASCSTHYNNQNGLYFRVAE